MSSLDISKCKNEDCTLKETCSRYTSKPKEFFQSYTNFSQNEDGFCDYFKSNKK